MITKADIEASKPVIVKWDKPLQSSGVATDGVMAGQASEFLTRIENESELLGLLRYVEMDGETQDIQSLRVRPNLMSMEKLASPGPAGAQVDPITSLTETTPTILKKKVSLVNMKHYLHLHVLLVLNKLQYLVKLLVLMLLVTTT